MEFDKTISVAFVSLTGVLGSVLICFLVIMGMFTLDLVHHFIDGTGPFVR